MRALNSSNQLSTTLTWVEINVLLSGSSPGLLRPTSLPSGMMSYVRRTSGGPVLNGRGLRFSAVPKAKVGDVMTSMKSRLPARALKMSDFPSGDQRG